LVGRKVALSVAELVASMAEHLVATMVVCWVARMVAWKELQMVGHWVDRWVCYSAAMKENL